MKYLILFLFIPFISTSQIRIDQVHKDWSIRVDSALAKIKSLDTVYYSRIVGVCDTILFINSKFSTCNGEYGKKGSILISYKDMRINSIDNICAVIIHESLHLKIRYLGLIIPEREEERMCYTYEIEFLNLIPNVNQSLIKHAEYQIKKISEN